MGEDLRFGSTVWFINEFEAFNESEKYFTAVILVIF